jgi:hypothetical protein
MQRRHNELNALISEPVHSIVRDRSAHPISRVVPDQVVQTAREEGFER